MSTRRMAIRLSTVRLLARSKYVLSSSRIPSQWTDYRILSLWPLSIQARNVQPRHSVWSQASRKHARIGSAEVERHPSSEAPGLYNSTTETYSRPKSGILAFLPASWVPYAELIRLDKPTGTYYLFFPCLFSTLMAAPLAAPMASPSAVICTSALFFAGALIMRGAGCTINDLLDRNLDPHVTRTKLRPIARGAITPFQGVVFTGVQLLAGLAILLQFPLECFFYATPSLLLVASYPLAKRVTYYPQLVLGLTFSWGAMMGFPAIGVDLLTNSSASAAAGLLYSSNVAWTVLYDMIYAHMDIKDDAKAKIKSMALKHDVHTKKVLVGLAATQVALLAGAGLATGAGPVFFIGGCGGALISLGIMIQKVNLKSVRDCWWWFVNGCWLTGGVISLGMTANYVVKYVQWTGKEDCNRIGAAAT